MSGRMAICGLTGGRWVSVHVTAICWLSADVTCASVSVGNGLEVDVEDETQSSGPPRILKVCGEVRVAVRLLEGLVFIAGFVDLLGFSLVHFHVQAIIAIDFLKVSLKFTCRSNRWAHGSGKRGFSMPISALAAAMDPSIAFLFAWPAEKSAVVATRVFPPFVAVDVQDHVLILLTRALLSVVDNIRAFPLPRG